MIPTLVGALYLWSNWDPYGKTDQVPVAVVNEDVSVEVEGQTIDAGDRLAAELRSNPIFDWQFVDRDQAEAGLSDGSYYMIVSIPADFSENLISGAGANPDRAVVDIVLNDSNNYLMELLAASAQNELEAAIDRAAVGAYFESVFANLDTIRTEVLAASSNASQLAARVRANWFPGWPIPRRARPSWSPASPVPSPNRQRCHPGCPPWSRAPPSCPPARMA